MSLVAQIMLICLLPHFFHDLRAWLMLIAHSVTCIHKCCVTAILRTRLNKKIEPGKKSKNGGNTDTMSEQSMVCKEEVTLMPWKDCEVATIVQGHRK